jgi:tryptophanyl-tRNA synthetase
VVPQARVDEQIMTVPGTDGQKMSKSYGNTIDIFLPEKELKKVVMGIVTDSKALEDAKDPETDNVFALYKLLAPAEQVEEMRQKYLKGGYGYGHAKQALLEIILDKYTAERASFANLMANPAELVQLLITGEHKARQMAQAKLARVRQALGF